MSDLDEKLDDLYDEISDLRAALRKCRDALMSTDIAKPDGDAQVEWQEAIMAANDQIGED